MKHVKQQHGYIMFFQKNQIIIHGQSRLFQAALTTFGMCTVAVATSTATTLVTVSARSQFSICHLQSLLMALEQVRILIFQV